MLLIGINASLYIYILELGDELVLENLSMNDWYAAFVATGEEDRVKERLNYRYEDKIRVLVPKRKLRERKNGVWRFTTRILFPGYVLLNGSNNDISGCDFRSVPKLIKPLKSGMDMLRIDRKEMIVLSRLICNNEVIDFSNVLVENGRVKVIDGPLVSMEGVIASVDHRKGRARVRLSFLGDERIIELGVSVLSPISQVSER